MHGQIRRATSARRWRASRPASVDVLVATSVIEVGIDVPNATVIVIEEAERYGLSQLHQLRGRVGRGEHESYCLLFSDARSELSPPARGGRGERDGFRLAEVDLTLRGEGDVLGTRKHGPAGVPGSARCRGPRAARAARDVVDRLLAADPELADPSTRARRVLDAALRRARGRADRGVRVVAGEYGGRRLRRRAARAPRPTAGPGARGAVRVLGATRGRAGARPVRGLRGARHRGALAWRAGGHVRRLGRCGGAGRAPEPRADRGGAGRACFRADALSFLRGAARHGDRCDLVLCDPPYRLAHRLGATLGPLLGPVLAPGGRIVCESSVKDPMRLDLPLLDERRYGDTRIAVHTI